MVYLALTPQGLQEVLTMLDAMAISVWCSADAISEAEFSRLKRRNVTRLNYSVPYGDHAAIMNALGTIHDHHPGERIWIESVAG